MGLWTIVDFPGKGKGVIARKHICPGTLLMSETPLLTTDCITSTDSTERDVARAFRSLPKESRQVFLSLHNNYPEESLSNIIKSNGLPLGLGAEIGGVFTNISRINHSCRPNTIHTWNPISRQETVYAVRQICIGEEVTISYHHGGPSTVRQQFLKEAFGFDCCCEACSLPPNDLRKSDARLIRAQYLDCTIGDSKTVHYFPLKVLKNGRTLLDIFKIEGIKDDRISRLYYDLFQVCNMHSDQARASAFAQKYYDAKRISAGHDGNEVLEMKPFIKDPSKHNSFGSTEDWKTTIDQVPKGVDEESFEKWLWKQEK